MNYYHVLHIDPHNAHRYYPHPIECTSGGTTSPSSAVDKTVSKGKEARIARAQQREAEKVLRKIEKKIDQLTKEQAALTKEMTTRRDADFAAINIRLARIQTEIQQLEVEWEQAAEELDGLM